MNNLEYFIPDYKVVLVALGRNCYQLKEGNNALQLKQNNLPNTNRKGFKPGITLYLISQNDTMKNSPASWSNCHHSNTMVIRAFYK